MNRDKKFWGAKTLLVLTGASQGIGQTIATEFSKEMGRESVALLIARSKAGLDETAAMIKESSPNVTVQVEPYDLSKPDTVELNEILKKFTSEKFEQYILVHNAGSEGDGSLAREMSNLDELRSYMDLNLHSLIVLTSLFLQLVPEGRRCIINITSLAALQPFKGMAYYCIGKASRELYLRTLAEEEPSLDILNYSPGPVQTAMVDRLIGKLKSEEVKGQFVSMRDSGTLGKREATVRKLVEALGEGSYSSGGRLDYVNL